MASRSLALSHRALRNAFAGVCALGALTACRDVESTDVLTTGVGPNFNVILDGEGDARVVGSLHVGDAESLVFLELIGDDHLEASLGDQVKPMEKVSDVDFNAPTYVAMFAEADAVGNDVAIAFHRTIDAGAPESVVNVPQPFDVTAPVEGLTASRAEDLIVSFSRPLAEGETATVTIVGSCLTVSPIEVTSGDSVTFLAGTIARLEPEEGQAPPAEECTAEISVVIKKSGTVDAAYGEAGFIIAEQDRMVSINSVL